MFGIIRIWYYCKKKARPHLVNAVVWARIITMPTMKGIICMADSYVIQNDSTD
jgi:hypothetical protein